MKLSFIVYFPIYTFLITNVFSHGSVGDPVSRSYRIFQENPESPKDVASLAAIETAGTQSFYDWHEVSRLVPEYDPESIEAYRAIIPDNQLAGAGRQKYSGLDLVRDDWPATSVNPGPYPVIFDAWTPHDPSYFLAFITREDWTPDQTLKWDDLESLSGTDLVVRDGNYYRFTVNFPPRIGKHILYVIWQRNDPAGEVFFSTSDIDFGDGKGIGNPSNGIGDINIPGIKDIRAEVDFSIQNDWNSGFTGEAEITNLADHPINSWELEFEIEQEISSFWNAELIKREGNHYTVRHAGWNQSIPVGGSVKFGFSAIPGNLKSISPSHLTLNGVSLHTHAHEEHHHPFEIDVSAILMPSEVIDQLNLSFPTKVGSAYIIQASSDLHHWETIESGIDGNGSTIKRQFSALRRNGFFRVTEE
ncbi:MAG: lytic polysaccharide monooxygenase [Verrucomicrobiales bacterium]|nr:lytic polysaccharide monooxygenase [Verrucomicrobiales bacterium]